MCLNDCLSVSDKIHEEENNTMSLGLNIMLMQTCRSNVGCTKIAFSSGLASNFADRSIGFCWIGQQRLVCTRDESYSDYIPAQISALLTFTDNFGQFNLQKMRGTVCCRCILDPDF